MAVAAGGMGKRRREEEGEDPRDLATVRAWDSLRMRCPACQTTSYLDLVVVVRNTRTRVRGWSADRVGRCPRRRICSGSLAMSRSGAVVELEVEGEEEAETEEGEVETGEEEAETGEEVAETGEEVAGKVEDKVAVAKADGDRGEGEGEGVADIDSLTATYTILIFVRSLFNLHFCSLTPYHRNGPSDLGTC